jgi:uncharacterized membrane protein
MVGIMPIAAFVASLVAMAVIDGIWLALVARNFYRDNLGHLLADSTNWVAAVAFYFIYVAGITFSPPSPASRRVPPSRPPGAEPSSGSSPTPPTT